MASTTRDGEVELTASVRFEAPAEERFTAFFRWPEAYGCPETIGDPFLAGLIVPAMSCGERLAIEAPVSRALLAALRTRILPVVRRWGWDDDRIEVTTQETGETAGAIGPTGLAPAALGSDAPDGPLTCFFSAGVDSWYSLMRHVDEVSHLLLMHGFEVNTEDARAWETAHAHIRSIAEDLGKTLVVITTNVGEVSVSNAKKRMQAQGRPEEYLHFRRYSGSMQVAVALCLQQQLHRFMVPTTWPWEFLEQRGSHPLLEPQWSTTAARFALDGGEADRIDKVRWLFEHAPDALRRLRVCFLTEHGEVNCGKCSKCLRTMLEMRVVGAADLVQSFEAELDMHNVRMTSFPGRNPYFWPKLLEEAERIGDHEVAEAVHTAFGRRFYWPRVRRLVGRWLRQRWLSAPGRRFTLRMLGRLPRS
ncbi:MAG: hypothetical protein ACYTCU_04155 [Planctomycetota bacterium]